MTSPTSAQRIRWARAFFDALIASGIAEVMTRKRNGEPNRIRIVKDDRLIVAACFAEAERKTGIELTDDGLRILPGA